MIFSVMTDDAGHRFVTIGELFDASFKDRDPTTGALRLPLLLAHVVGPVPQLIQEIGTRLPTQKPADVLVVAEIVRLNVWGCAAHLFGPTKPEWGSPPDYPGITHTDTMYRWIEDVVPLVADPGWRGMIDFDPGNAVPAEAFELFWKWWAPRAAEVYRQRDAELATRSEPSDPVVRLIFDAVRPQWRSDKRYEPHALLAYRQQRFQAFFHDNPDATARHLNRTIERLLPGLRADPVYRAHLHGIVRRTGVDDDRAEEALLGKLAEVAPATARAMEQGMPARRIFGPVEVNPDGAIKAHIDRDGIVGSDAVVKSLEGELAVDRREASFARESQEAHELVDAAPDLTDIRDSVDEIRRLREACEAADDPAALGFIDWKMETKGSLPQVARAHGVTVKAIRSAERRVAARLIEIRAA